MTQPDVVKEFLCPLSPKLKENIISFREQLSNDIHSSVPSQRIIILGSSGLTDHNQSIACSKWLLNKTKPGTYPVDDIIKSTFLPDRVLKLFGPTKDPVKNLKIAMFLNINGEIQSGSSSYMTQAAAHGVVNSRTLLIDLAENIPVVGDIGDPISSQYFNDLFCAGLISPHNIESQVHRELASGVPFPVGFNASSNYSVSSNDILNYKIQKAANAMSASADPHYFLSVTNLGSIAIVSTIGNKDGFLILQTQHNSLLLNLSHLLAIIDEALINFKTAKVVLDLGKVPSSTMKQVLYLVDQLLRSPIVGDSIIGFIIDSGEKYIPDNIEAQQSVLLTDRYEQDSLNDLEIFSFMSEHIGVRRAKRPSMKNKLLRTMKSSYTKIYSTIIDNKNSDSSKFQHFMNADTLINEIDAIIERIKSDV